MVPRELLDLAVGGKVVEVGVGRDLAAARAFLSAGAAEVVVTDVRPDVVDVPPPLRGVVDDVFEPDVGIYEGAVVVYGVRLPEELQVPAQAIARRVGALYAVRPLKDELADVPAGTPRMLGAGWRLWGGTP